MRKGPADTPLARSCLLASTGGVGRCREPNRGLHASAGAPGCRGNSSWLLPYSSGRSCSPGEALSPVLSGWHHTDAAPPSLQLWLRMQTSPISAEQRAPLPLEAVKGQGLEGKKYPRGSDGEPWRRGDLSHQSTIAPTPVLTRKNSGSLQ